jgi:hypothetical protein
VWKTGRHTPSLSAGSVAGSSLLLQHHKIQRQAPSPFDFVIWKDYAQSTPSGEVTLVFVFNSIFSLGKKTDNGSKIIA